MARMRSLRPDYFLREDMADVSLEAHFLLGGLAVLADHDGRLEDKPRRIWAQVFPYRQGIDVDALLNDLVRVGAIARHEHEGRRVVTLVSWDDHWPRPSALPIEDIDPEPVVIPRIRIRMKTPEERAQAEAEHARMLEENRQRAQRERSHREAMKAAKRASARVYFVQQDGSECLVKIGTTTRAVEVRLRGLQAGHSCPLVVRASAPGGRSQESDLHWRFSALRVSGEWFRPGPDLMAYIALVADRGTL
jgi:hypothetical protein